MNSPLEIRPRRSVLFMPGVNARAMNKARTLPADVVVFDLEDAVAPGFKAEARERVKDTLLRGGFGQREVIVRINDLNSPWGDEDVSALAALEPDGVLLPKVESPDQVHAALDALDAAGGAALVLWAMIETPAGVLRAREIAGASRKLVCLVMGTSDLATALRVPPGNDRAGLVTPLSWCVTVARAFELDILDGVQLDLEDETAYRRACLQGRSLGFDGKTLIHPRQIALANEIFAPGEEDVALAREVIGAFERARSEGRGVAVVRGRLVENLHVEEARRTLALAEAISAMEAAGD